VRLHLAHLIAIEPAQSFEAVGGAAPLQVAQARHFRIVGRHHQLPQISCAIPLSRQNAPSGGCPKTASRALSDPGL